jgi:hypothetical protein
VGRIDGPRRTGAAINADNIQFAWSAKLRASDTPWD